MKNKILKWLRIETLTERVAEIEDVLTDPHKTNKEGKNYIGSELDIKLQEKDFEHYKSLYADCYNCGSLCRKRKMTMLPVMCKDVDTGALTEYNLWYGFQSLYTSGNFDDDKTQAIYFCVNCPAKLPKKKKAKSTYHNII